MWEKPILPTLPDFGQKYLSVFVRGLSRFLSLFFEYPAIEDMFKVKKMLRDESGYDIIISFAVPYPVHWGVAWAMDRRKQNATKWVADCGDPYMGDVLDTFRKPFYFAYRKNGFVEEQILSRFRLRKPNRGIILNSTIKSESFLRDSILI